MFCRPTLGYFDARQFLVSTVGQIVIVLLSMNGWNDSVKNNKVTWEWNPKQVNYCKHMSSVYKKNCWKVLQCIKPTMEILSQQQITR